MIFGASEKVKEKKREKVIAEMAMMYAYSSTFAFEERETHFFCYNGGMVQTVMSAETKLSAVVEFAKDKGYFLAVGWREKWEWVLTGRV